MARINIDVGNSEGTHTDSLTKQCRAFATRLVAMFSLLNFDLETYSESWIALLTAEIATELVIIEKIEISLNYSITCVES